MDGGPQGRGSRPVTARRRSGGPVGKGVLPRRQLRDVWAVRSLVITEAMGTRLSGLTAECALYGPVSGGETTAQVCPALAEATAAASAWQPPQTAPSAPRSSASAVSSPRVWLLWTPKGIY